MIRTLLVDDERAARERLRRLLSEHPEVQVVGEASDGRQALERIGELAPDVVLLDIEMPELGGIEVAAAIDGPAVVFVTAYDQHALDAFEVAAVDYLVKPVRRDRLAAALRRVKARAAAGTDAGGGAEAMTRLLRAMGGAGRRVALKSGSSHVFVESDDILVVWAQDHYTEVRTVDGRTILCDESLDAMDRRLAAGPFLRVHRSAILNTERIDAFEREGDRRYVAVLTDGSRVPVARDRLKATRAALGIE